MQNVPEFYKTNLSHIGDSSSYLVQCSLGRGAKLRQRQTMVIKECELQPKNIIVLGRAARSKNAWTQVVSSVCIYVYSAAKCIVRHVHRRSLQFRAMLKDSKL